MSGPKVLSALLLLAVTLSASSSVGCLDTGGPTESSQRFSEDTYALYVDGEHRGSLTLEVADSPEEWRRGLKHRRSLPEGRGMLFVFPSERRMNFWMEDTYLPLDIIFMDGDMRVLNVERASPQPNASRSELELHPSEGGAKFVIEAERGFAERRGIEPGSVIELVPRGRR